MLSRLTDFDQTFDVLDELRRQMDRVWTDFDGQTSASWPRLQVFDAGANLVVTAEVPGMTEKELDVALQDGVMTLSGERAPLAPEGYAVHRRERPALRFSRSVALPVKIDADRTTASVKDGILTITLAKAPEARPRQIAVRAQG